MPLTRQKAGNAAGNSASQWLTRFKSLWRETRFKVFAILGGDVGSPGCAVHLSTGDETNQKILEGSGVFIKELYAELAKRNIEIPLRGIRDSNMNELAEDISWIDRLSAKS